MKINRSANLIDKKNSNEAIFLGCGPSINDLSDSDWQKIKKMDIWTSNNWFIHDVVPDFYHLEVKMHRNGQFAKDMVAKKHGEYKDVNWILDITRPYLFDIVRPDVYKNIFGYKKTYRGNDGNYTPSEHMVQVSCMASITIILDLMQKMGYDKIYFCGVDLYSSEYFWTNNDKYLHHKIPHLIATCKPDERSPSDPHTTLKTAQFIKEFGSYNQINFVNLSNRSELMKYIPTESLN
tara:strand:- start:12904 stop:13611 length:708 start_codon:yes stop_codon:yes gene_type:complete